MNITQSEIILHPVFVQKILEKIVIENSIDKQKELLDTDTGALL